MSIDLAAITDKVSKMLSEKRFSHTLGVVQAAKLLGEHCLPDKIVELQAAALLHDVAKELTTEEQVGLIERDGVILTDEDIDNPEVLHSYAAPCVIKSLYAEASTEEILSAVAKHTLGDTEMSIFDEIIFISDYIESGRKYPACISTRDFLIKSLTSDDVNGNLLALHKACIMAIDYTIDNLSLRGKRIHSKTLKAKTALLAKIS